METADRYRDFAEHQAKGSSPAYEQLARAVANDGELIRMLDELPRVKRQPNLLLGAARSLGAPVSPPDAWLTWVHARWPEVCDVMQRRSTQTNEPGRCATLLPVLAALPQPLALLEVGASAGLCLYPDAYRYSYRRADREDVHVVGPTGSPVTLGCDVTGDPPLPDAVPRVVWRAGLDLNPLDVTDDDDLRWLETLIWPGHDERRTRLRAAAGIARADPPHLVRGDLLHDLPALAALAPADATLVVFHSAVLAYVPREIRDGFVDTVSALPGHWISNEAPSVLPQLTPPEAAGSGPGEFVLALDGHAKGLTAPHGQALRWLG